MKITPIKTPPVHPHDSLEEILSNSIESLPENSVLAVTSKIVSLCEGRIADPSSVTKDDLVSQEAAYYLPREHNKYGFCLSIKRHTLIASAGIDESNADGQYVLWPKDAQESANQIRKFLQQHFKVKNVGVTITDSHVLPLRWGTSGTSIAHSGFLAIKDYMGKPDIFGRKMRVTRSNIAEGLAAAAVVCMGEGSEQTPLALVTELPFVEFQDRDPSEEELAMSKIDIEDDVFAPILTGVSWEKGQGE